MTLLLCLLSVLATPGQEDVDHPARKLMAGTAASDKPKDNPNKGLLEGLQPSGFLPFLTGLDVELKAFETSEGENGLGFAYTYSRSFMSEPLGAGAVSFSANAQGNVAFDKDVNPTDFLQTSLSLDLWQDGGMDFDEGAWGENDWIELRKLVVEHSKDKNFIHRKEVRALVQKIRDAASPHWYLEGKLNAGLESNQDFTEKQYTLGAHVFLDHTVFSSKSDLRYLNLFDYPAAIVRLLSGYEKPHEDFPWIRPSGFNFPTVLAGLDYVAPQDDDPRADVGDDSDFWRAKLSLSYRGEIARVSDVRVFFDAHYRIYQELAPERAIEKADLDFYRYYALAIRSSVGVFASYTAGKLPLDDENDVVYEAGFAMEF